MARGTRSDDLPAVIPVFPLSGALLLPGGRLPLTVFEPRYLALTDDALGAGRLFGMIQPLGEGGGDATGPAEGLYSVGCLGRISSFAETGDGRYLIAVTGLCRFRVAGEEQGRSGYRRLRVEYGEFAADLHQAGDTEKLDRERLVEVVRSYLDGHGVGINWGLLDGAPDSTLVTTLAMTCPFSPEEKQALLECPSLAERCRIMTALIEMALLAESGGGPLH
jgi:hypothetical protein